MDLFQKISTARSVLELQESATMDTIKSNYKRLIRKWHPDTCNGNENVCEEMTRDIISAYELIVIYCNNYQYSFSQDEVGKYLSPEEWWIKRFGEDPLW